MKREPKKCVLCGVGPREIPDRDRMSPQKRVCRECHAARLRGDLHQILALHRKRAAEQAAPEADHAQ